MNLSVITVCYNCKDDLQKTLSSLEKQSGVSFESIVVDGNSKDGTLEVIKSSPIVKRWVSEPDKGIYDAMNKGLGLATGDAILFLNAGDYIVGDILSKIKSSPGFIPVKTKPWGQKERILSAKNPKQGMPYCHQGILFERKNIQYNLNYKIASDYDFYLRHQYRDLPFLLSSDLGYIYYDNSGFSFKNAHSRDQEIQSIISLNFGPLWAGLFAIKALAKRSIKKLTSALR